MTQAFGRQAHGSRELSDDELDHVSGGMKWDRGHKSPNVIDARGGQVETWFGTFTFDVHGKVSSYNPPS
jgi:bacteriocin-like protein